MTTSGRFPSNRAHLEYVYAETAKGNGQPFLDALADDACWTIGGSTPWSKTYRGKAAILAELIAPLRRRLAPPLRTHARRFIADGDLVAVEGYGENVTRDGAPYANTYCWVFEFREGAVVAITEYADTELFRSALGDPLR
ncbi:MAG TPA: nuclear transport factor 2 family protein [Candidatus Sulfotelmatobacter sp.]|nr:nuclear transport factor 2 family protein [Candidatus Sulfotelmatobacter sp.]